MCTGRVCRPPSRELTKISFTQFTGGVIVFKALLDDFKDSLTFVLDTGSGGISLDSATVAGLGLHPSEPERMIRGIGEPVRWVFERPATKDQ